MYHVLNRSSGRRRLFCRDEDYAPVERPGDWLKLLNEPQPEPERERVKTSIERNRPLGDDGWTARMANRLEQGHTLRDPGRPKKPVGKERKP